MRSRPAFPRLAQEIPPGKNLNAIVGPASMGRAAHQDGAADGMLFAKSAQPSKMVSRRVFRRLDLDGHGAFSKYKIHLKAGRGSPVS